ncbi:Membrane protein [Sphingomonas paucimobilis]|nr:Membrane protein [Sphingomonas paucimobilis]
MDGITIARAIHVLAVVLWIGGVAFVTLVLMPSIRRGSPPDQWLATFHRFEERFAGQARLWVLIAGASGLWMIDRGQMWSRFADLHFWWMHAMLAVWTVFAAMLFLIEPLGLHQRLKRSGRPATEFRRMEWMHRILLLLAAITVLGAVAGR